MFVMNGVDSICLGIFHSGVGVKSRGNVMIPTREVRELFMLLIILGAIIKGIEHPDADRPECERSWPNSDLGGSQTEVLQDHVDCSQTIEFKKPAESEGKVQISNVSVSR